MNPKFEYAQSRRPYHNPYLAHVSSRDDYDPSPPRSFYSAIEPAFQVKGNQSNIIPMALGPPSKAIGGCIKNFPGVRGVCVGAFPSQWVHMSEPQLGHCLFESHRGVEVGKIHGCNNNAQRHTRSDLDPAGTLTYYESQPRYHYQKQSALSDKTSPQCCESYSSYSACPNCSLSSGIGNSVLGEYGVTSHGCS